MATVQTYGLDEGDLGELNAFAETLRKRKLAAVIDISESNTRPSKITRSQPQQVRSLARYKFILVLNFVR